MDSYPPSYILSVLCDTQLVFLVVGLKGVWKKIAADQGWKEEILQFADPADQNPDYTAAKKLLIKLDCYGWTLDKLTSLLQPYSLDFLVPDQSIHRCYAGDQIGKMVHNSSRYALCY